MDHPFLQVVAEDLADAGVATLRFQFPYMEEGRRRPDPPHLLEATVRSAVAAARERLPHLPLIAGGKSMGGRMTSQAQAKQPLEGVRGIVFLGFPLHPRGRPGDRRAEHLAHVSVPMLFLQGSRDQLATLERLAPVCRRLGKRAHLHVIDGADHSFSVLKRSGRTHEQVLAELVDAIAAWSEALIG
jgi:predicted alpha/beta-hydrolase family hydrolase